MLSRHLEVYRTGLWSICKLWVSRSKGFARNLDVLWLEDHWCLGGSLCEWNTQLEKLGDDGREVLEEELVVLGVLLDPWLEGLVRDQSHVGWKHHESLGGLVLVLLKTLADSSFRTQEFCEAHTCLGPFHFLQFHFSPSSSL